MENIYLNETILKVFPNGEIWKFGHCKGSKKQTWYPLLGSINIKNKYPSHHTTINNKNYITSRVLAYAFLRFDLDDTVDTIDHQSRNSLDNHISNLRCASRLEQILNRSINIQAKGWCLRNGKYIASIKINWKSKHLGTYDTPEEAHQAYLRAVALNS